jgi:hypothetical protein
MHLEAFSLVQVLFRSLLAVPVSPTIQPLIGEL